MNIVPAVSLLIAAGFAAGCLDGGALVQPATPQDEGEAPAPDAGPTHRPRAPSGTTTAVTAAPSDATWPALESATIRPGVRTYADGAQCTSNFLFESATSSDLYLGVASHCVDTIDVGDPVTIETTDGSEATGTLAYSAWKALGLDCDDDVGNGCTSGGFVNDFALIRIADADHARAHPAMLRFGGPLALADASEVRTGDRVLSYGNSGLRLGLEPSNWHEGYVISGHRDAQFRAYMLAPGVPGDSGSGVLDGQGNALGVLVTVGLAPVPGDNGVVGLKGALDMARENGVDVHVSTWDVLDPGLLP